MTRIKKYWLEIIAFSLIFAVLMICLAPGMTWINTDSDGAHYILSAKYMGVAHNTSAPLFLLIGRLFLWLPFGTDAWRMGLISVIATTVCAIFIYKSVKKLSGGSKGRIYALLASLLYGTSALVISQSTIIESYALSTMFSVIAYYSCLNRRWVLACVAMGLTLATHPLFFAMTWIVLIIAYKELRTKKRIALTFSFVLFYSYVLISKAFSDTPVMWGNSDPLGFLKNNFGTMWMLAGGIALVDLPKRVIDTILILGISLGAGIAYLVWYYKNHKPVRNPLFWLFAIPVFYFIINLSAETYVYIMPAIAFASVSVGVGLARIKDRTWKYIGLAVTYISVIGFMIFNVNYLDIGRTLDPNLSAQRYYDQELPKIGDGEIYLGGGWTWAIAYLYNKEEGRNIIPICTDILPSQEYLDQLEESGIKLIRTDSESFIDRQWLVAQSIVELNDNVWIAKETIPEEYQYEIVRADANIDLITRWLGHEVEPKIAWKPSNPYHYITGALEISEWRFILKTNHNARFAIMWAIYGIGAIVLFEKIFKRKKNETQTKTEEETNTTTS